MATGTKNDPIPVNLLQAKDGKYYSLGYNVTGSQQQLNTLSSAELQAGTATIQRVVTAKELTTGLDAKYLKKKSTTNTVTHFYDLVSSGLVYPTRNAQKYFTHYWQGQRMLQVYPKVEGATRKYRLIVYFANNLNSHNATLRVNDDTTNQYKDFELGALWGAGDATAMACVVFVIPEADKAFFETPNHKSYYMVYPAGTPTDKTHIIFSIKMEITDTLLGEQLPPNTGATPKIPASLISWDDYTYSNTPTIVGRWIDGKLIYRKVLTFTSITPSLPHGITNLNTVVKAMAMVKNRGDSGWRNLPWIYSVNNPYPTTWAGGFYILSSDILFQTGSDLGSIHQGHIILEYTTN